MTTDVLIIGAGPAGTALAIDLVRRGLDIRIIDKAPRSFDGSRAKGIQPRTQEVFADLGMLREILAGGSLYPKLGIHLGPLTAPWRMYRTKQPSADIPYPNTWLIPQYRTDAVLHARPSIRLAASYRNGRVFLAGADPGLLDSYEAERLPVAAAVLGLSTEKYNDLSKLDTSSIRRGKDEQQLALSYLGGDRTTTLRAGDRAPDATLHDGTRLFDSYRGPHFTAMADGPRATEALDRLDWPSAGAQLKRLVIDARTDTGTFRRVYGLTEDTLLLIRPDGYIGHIATHGISAATQVAVRALTSSVKRCGFR